MSANLINGMCSRHDIIGKNMIHGFSMTGLLNERKEERTIICFLLAKLNGEGIFSTPVTYRLPSLITFNAHGIRFRIKKTVQNRPIKYAKLISPMYGLNETCQYDGS